MSQTLMPDGGALDVMCRCTHLGRRHAGRRGTCSHDTDPTVFPYGHCQETDCTCVAFWPAYLTAKAV